MVRGAALQKRGGVGDFELLGAGGLQLAVNPIWGSSGHFCGHDFSPDFGHRFDDAILAFLID